MSIGFITYIDLVLVDIFFRKLNEIKKKRKPFRKPELKSVSEY